jgi:adenosylhomocysteine nucleosidase
MMNLVVALKAEARPLIRHYELQHRHAGTTFPVYLGTDMALVVSGPGKAAAAAATEWLQGLTQGNKGNAWLNIGIAGHASYAVGNARIANRITEQATNRSWYPPQVYDLDIETGRLLTVDTPENDYTVDALYDMEAAGFYPAACRFSSSELVQCFKIVSDNKMHTNTKITAKHCEQLVGSQLKTINSLVETLANMQKQYSTCHAPGP